MASEQRPHLQGPGVCWCASGNEAAKARVREFLTARKTVIGRRGGLDEDVIYSVGTDDGTIDLTVSDLEELIR